MAKKKSKKAFGKAEAEMEEKGEIGAFGKKAKKGKKKGKHAGKKRTRK